MHTMRTRFAFLRALKRLAKAPERRLSPLGVKALPFLPMARRLHLSACPAGRGSRTLPLLPTASAPGWAFSLFLWLLFRLVIKRRVGAIAKW
jgi:hypothetical protein